MLANRSRKMLAPRMASPVTIPKYSAISAPSMLGVVVTSMMDLPALGSGRARAPDRPCDAEPQCRINAVAIEFGYGAPHGVADFIRWSGRLHGRPEGQRDVVMPVRRLPARCRNLVHVDSHYHCARSVEWRDAGFLEHLAARCCF